MTKKINKQAVLIIILLILVIAAFSYIAFSFYDQSVQDEQLRSFQIAAQYGYEQAILQVMQQVSTCEQVPLFAGNTTINVIAVDCLATAAE